MPGDGADEGQRAARAATRVLDDRLARGQPTGAFGAGDHRPRHAVLVRAGRVAGFELDPDLGRAVLGEGAEAGDGRVPDGVQHVRSVVHPQPPVGADCRLLPAPAALDVEGLAGLLEAGDRRDQLGVGRSGVALGGQHHRPRLGRRPPPTPCPPTASPSLSAWRRWWWACSRSPTSAHAIAAGTDSMIEQNTQRSSVPERRLGAVDDGPGRQRVGRGEDHRAVDPLQQVAGHASTSGRGAGPGRAARRASSPSPRRQADLGQALQRVGLAGRRAEVVVQVDGLLQLVGGELEVAGQQRRLADQRRRRTPRRAARRCAAPCRAGRVPCRSRRRTGVGP